MPTLAEVISGPEALPSETLLDALETSMATSTIDPTPRAVRINWTLAHGHDELAPDPPTLGRLRELFDGHYAFRGPNQLHSQHIVAAEWVTPAPGEAHPGHVPTDWIRVNE